MLQFVGPRPGTALCGHKAPGVTLRTSQHFLGTRRALVGLRRNAYLRPTSPVMAILGGHEPFSRRMARELQELRPGQQQQKVAGSGAQPQASSMWHAAASALSGVQERIADFERGAQQMAEAHTKGMEALHAAAAEVAKPSKQRVTNLVSMFERGVHAAATASKGLRSVAAPQPYKMSEESTARLAALNAEMDALREALKEASLVSGTDLAQPTPVVAAAVAAEEAAVRAAPVEEAPATPAPQPRKEEGKRGGKDYVFGVFAAAAGALANAFQPAKSAKSAAQPSGWQAAQGLFSFTNEKAMQAEPVQEPEQEPVPVIAMEASVAPAPELVDVEVVCPEEAAAEAVVIRGHNLDDPALFGAGLLPLEVAAEEAMPGMLPVAAMLWGSSMPGAPAPSEVEVEVEAEPMGLQLVSRPPTGAAAAPVPSWPVSKAMASLGFVMTFYSIARYRVQGRGSNMLPLAPSALRRLEAGSGSSAPAAASGAGSSNVQHLAALSRIEERLAGIGQRLASIEERVSAMKRG